METIDLEWLFPQNIVEPTGLEDVETVLEMDKPDVQNHVETVLEKTKLEETAEEEQKKSSMETTDLAFDFLEELVGDVDISEVVWALDFVPGGSRLKKRVFQIFKMVDRHPPSFCRSRHRRRHRRQRQRHHCRRRRRRRRWRRRSQVPIGRRRACCPLPPVSGFPGEIY